MITKIKKIQNLGIFKDYSHETNTGDFRKFNIIYGWNGSGKTTLSELFTFFSKGASGDFPNLKYVIQCEGNQNYRELEKYNKKIRVFNQKYITENINLVEGSAKSILILGKEQKSLLEVIAQDEKKLNGDSTQEGSFGKVKNLENKQGELKNKKKEKGQIFTNVAKVISEHVSGVAARNYTKKNAQSAFEKLKTKKILSQADKKNHSTTLKQQPKENLICLKSPLGDVSSIIDQAKLFLKKTVSSVIIERLKNNPNISKWVEEGISLHKSVSNCEFCNQILPEQRIKDLSEHFNDEDNQLKSDLDKLLDLIDALVTKVKDLKIPEKANVYDEFK